MAEIDKGLPNVRQEIKIPPKDEMAQVVEQLQESMPSPDKTEIRENEDGSVDINFDPSTASPEQGDNHYANLADLLPDSVLDPLGSELYANYTDYRESRREWERSYTQGLDLLGFQFEQRTRPFQGASGATHPVLAEAVTQFQAQAYKELLPAAGPVRTQVLGSPSREKQDQAVRVKNFMNYQLMDVMKEFEPEFDQMLFYLPLAGSTFKKVYYDDLMERAVSKFVTADDLVVPYSATSLEDAEAICHVIKMSGNSL
jgi:ribosomal protein S30